MHCERPLTWIDYGRQPASACVSVGQPGMTGTAAFLGSRLFPFFCALFRVTGMRVERVGRAPRAGAIPSHCTDLSAYLPASVLASETHTSTQHQQRHPLGTFSTSPFSTHSLHPHPLRHPTQSLSLLSLSFTHTHQHRHTTNVALFQPRQRPSTNNHYMPHATRLTPYAASHATHLALIQLDG